MTAPSQQLVEDGSTPATTRHKLTATVVHRPDIPERQFVAALLLDALRHLAETNVETPAFQQARHFATALAGPWREAREFWCDLIDLDPEEYRRTARERLEHRFRAKRSPANTRDESGATVPCPPVLRAFSSSEAWGRMNLTARVA